MAKLSTAPKSHGMTRVGPASKNIQSTARARSSGAAQVAEAKSRNASVLKGRPSRGM